MPDMICVDSTSIAAVGFDAEQQALYVRFRTSGLTYVYYGVTQLLFEELLSAHSKGGFFNTRIRPSHAFARLGSASHEARAASSGRRARE